MQAKRKSAAVKTKPRRSVKTARNAAKCSRECLLKMQITIPARDKAIDPLVEAVLAVVRESELGEDKELEIETALREALANAIKHGCCDDPEESIHCSVVFEETGSVLIVVSDPGSGFDPESLPDPTLDENLLENHGRGIFLITRLMDEVKFERNGAEIHMRKY